MSGDDRPKSDILIELAEAKIAAHEASENLHYDADDLSRQHRDPSSKAKGLSRRYKSDPTIENYVRLRRKNPDVLINIAISEGMEWVHKNTEVLKDRGIPPQTLIGALDADPACISEVSLRLLELLVERRKLEASGETQVQSRGLAIRDSLVNYLIKIMLDALDWNDELYIPRDLLVLMRHQLGPSDSVEVRSLKVVQEREDASWLAAQLRYIGEEGSLRDVAEVMDVHPSSVSRWFNETETFERCVDEKLTLLKSDLMRGVRERLDSQKS